MQDKFTDEMRQVQERVDSSTSQIREISAQQNVITQKVEQQLAQLRGRQERKQRIQNLHRAIKDMRERIAAQGHHPSSPLPTLSIGDADKSFPTHNPANPPSSPQEHVRQLPDLHTLSTWLSTYNSLNASLAAHLNTLKARDGELEVKYRKVVSLCTNVDESKVDQVLGQLVVAVETETERDDGRVREFLRRVEAVGGS
jgi:regulatory protein SWI6